ncbi:MAG: hypothetical protein HY611_10645 [Elusimicrobia bacterium]|nr:hypothetical protein [Elusimicrobiota bacterium]
MGRRRKSDPGYKIHIRLGVLSNEGVFSRQTSEQIEASTKVVTVLAGEGPLEKLNTTLTTIDDKVVGRDYNGHSRLVIERGRHDEALARFDFLLNDMVNGFKTVVKNKYTVETRFSAGTWGDFLEGNPFALALTKAGERKVAKVISDTHKTILKQQAQIFRMLLASKGVKVAAARIGRVKVEGATMVAGDAETITVKGPFVKLEMTFKVTEYTPC